MRKARENGKDGRIMVEERETKPEGFRVRMGERIVTDPEEIHLIFHDQKLLILKAITSQKMNIQEIANTTRLNPGTVKRNLDDLIKAGFVAMVEIRENDYKMKMKYYQTTAEKITIRYQIP